MGSGLKSISSRLLMIGMQTPRRIDAYLGLHGKFCGWMLRSAPDGSRKVQWKVFPSAAGRSHICWRILRGCVYAKSTATHEKWNRGVGAKPIPQLEGKSLPLLASISIFHIRVIHDVWYRGFPKSWDTVVNTGLPQNGLSTCTLELACRTIWRRCAGTWISG